MDPVYSPSTRLRIVSIAVIVAGLREIARRYGFLVSDDVYFTIEAALLALAGLDTVRPLGLKPAKVPSAVGQIVSETLPSPPPTIVVELDDPE